MNHDQSVYMSDIPPYSDRGVMAVNMDQVHFFQLSKVDWIPVYKYYNKLGLEKKWLASYPSGLLFSEKIPCHNFLHDRLAHKGGIMYMLFK